MKAPGLDDERRANEALARVPRHAGKNDAGHEEHCWFCGKGLSPKAMESARWIHMATSNGLLSRDSPEMDDPHGRSQGCFPVGPACRGKIRRAMKEAGLNPGEWVFDLRELTS